MSKRTIGPISLIRPIALLGLLALMLLTSCYREPLELYYTGKATVHVSIDWQTRFGQRPTGMTIMLAKDGDAITFTDVTNSVDGYTLELEPGTYKMLIFNQSTGEFGSMGFAQTRSFTEAFAYARQLERVTDYWDVNCAYMREPEAIGCAVDTFTVLEDMIDGEYRFVDYRDKVENRHDILQLNEVIEPMTTEMRIRVKIIGIPYMASVIGNISGMADGFLLSQSWRRPQQGYHLLDQWRVERTRAGDAASDSSRVGYITTTIRTFGLPRGRELEEQRDSNSNMLSLCFTLIDDTRHVFRYPVGKHIKYRTVEVDSGLEQGDTTTTGRKQYFNKTDVTLELDLVVDAPFFPEEDIPTLPYAQPTGTGAFDAEVAPWGDEEQVDVVM